MPCTKNKIKKRDDTLDKVSSAYIKKFTPVLYLKVSTVYPINMYSTWKQKQTTLQQ